MLMNGQQLLALAYTSYVAD